MRLCLAFLLLSTPALADTIAARGPVTAVTLYPAGATVTRRVTFSAPAGQHEIVVPGLPAGTDPASLRVTAPAGVTVGAVSLASERVPATADLTSPEVQAAKDEVLRLQAVVDGKRREIAAIRARGEAAAARAAFVQALATGRAEGASLPDVETLRALAGVVGDEVLAATQAELQAEAEAVAATQAMEPEVMALAAAEAALAALTPPEGDSPAALVVTVQTSAPGETGLTVESVTADAYWAPVYDLRLTRQPAALQIDRGVTVVQETGEDWRDVALTLSTAQPGDQNQPSTLYPALRRIAEEQDQGYGYGSDRVADAVAGSYPEPVVAPEVIVQDQMAGFGFISAAAGAHFSHSFGAPVTIRSGADSLRLSLDRLTADVALHAEAVPLHDKTAYLVAEITNSSGQTLLPGTAMLYADGALVGQQEIELIPAQGKAELGFGAIHGLVLKRITPARSEGETGILTTANRQVEQAVITVENLTGETWPVRILDRVPYSEQDGLKISWTAEPPPAETDVEGDRGVLAWRFDLAPGATQEIRLDQVLDWPKGYVLQ